jgi:hypothetical protein
MKHLLTWALVLSSISTFSATKAGHIKGTVVDHDGNPVPAATVYVVSQEAMIEEMTPRAVKSDGNGDFDFSESFVFGSYAIYSRKPQDLYLDQSDKFYADPKAEPAKADLTDDHPSANVAVTLGAKASLLQGKLVDALSGEPTSASLAFLDEDGNGHVFFADRKFRFLLPSGKDLTVMMVGVGLGDKSQIVVNRLRLDAGQEMQMDIPVSK